MNSGFYPVYLAHLFDWTEPMHGRLNWLFVALDSCRDLGRTEKYLSPKLKQENISFEYKPEGLWLFYSDVVKPYVRDDVAVPFSASYIFDKNIKDCPKPSFNMTTDRGSSFSESEISAVVAEIKRINAIGYASDGCGLQWISFDDELSSLIRRGFESWEKAVQTT